MSKLIKGSRSFSRKLMAISLLLSGLCVSSIASADVYNLGTLPTGIKDTGVKTLTNSGSFSDHFDFQLAGPSNVSTGTAALNLIVGATKIFNIDDLKIEIFNSANTSLGSGSNFNLGLLSMGSYYAAVTGIVSGISGGLYSAGFSVSALSVPLTPVPEAETYAMLLLGLGVIGLVSRRRNKMKPTVFA